MKTITKKIFVAFLVALGFEKAGTWEDEKLTTRFSEVGDKVKEEDVPEGQLPLYKAIAGGEAKLDLSEEEEGEEAGPKPAKKNGAKPAKAQKPVGKEAPEKVPAKAEKTSAKKPAPKVEKAAKPAKAKKEKAPKEEREKDKYGAYVGTVRNKVNNTLTKEWTSQEDIIKKAGCDADKVKVCLRHGLEREFLEVRRIVEYRVKK